MESKLKRKRIDITQISDSKLPFKKSDKVGVFDVVLNETNQIKEIYMATKTYFCIKIYAFTLNSDFNFCPSRTELNITYLNMDTYINFQTITRNLREYEVQTCKSEEELFKEQESAQLNLNLWRNLVIMNIMKLTPTRFRSVLKFNSWNSAMNYLKETRKENVI